MGAYVGTVVLLVITPSVCPIWIPLLGIPTAPGGWVEGTCRIPWAPLHSLTQIFILVTSVLTFTESEVCLGLGRTSPSRIHSLHPNPQENQGFPVFNTFIYNSGGSRW